MINQFNLVDEPWIPVADHGKVSLKQLFAQDGYKALGGNPIQKIALFKLLFAISQAAATPKDELEWRAMSTQQLAEKCIAYLDKWYDSFYLYGLYPFLQMPNIDKAKVVPFGAVLPQIATGNTTVLTQSQVDKPLDHADKALLLLTLMGFALGGKKTDNSVVLTPNYPGKSNDKGKPSTSKPGPSVGHMGFLHNIIVAETVLDTLWINLFTEAKLKEMNLFPNLLGVAPWERMPEGEDCLVAQDLKQSYMGRLLPLARFCLLTENGLHYSEGIAHANYKEGQPDLTIAVNYAGKDPKALWTNPDKRPWRDVTSLLSFIVQSQAQGFQCWQIQNSVSRVRDHLEVFSIWSGGLSVSSNAGEQYVSGSNDSVESQFWLYSDELGESWYLRLKQGITDLDQLAKNLYGRVMAFYKEQTVDGANMAALASYLFWQLCERDFQHLLNCCGVGEGERAERKKLRMKFANYQFQAYDKYCPNETARQLDAWAKNKPNNFKYLNMEEA